MAEEQGSSETVDARACVLPYPRVGDAYRELAAERLCEYRAGGFLDQDEFEARRDIILSAKTAAEVECMFADLHTAVLPSGPHRRQLMPPVQVWTCTMLLLLGGMIGAGAARVSWLMIMFTVFTAGLVFAVIMAFLGSAGKNP